RPEAADGWRRRQRRAFPGTADRVGIRDRGIRTTAGARLRRTVRRQAEGRGGMSKPLRHFLDINELPPKELRNMLAASVAMKAKQKAHEINKPLEGKTLAMIFAKII